MKKILLVSVSVAVAAISFTFIACGADDAEKKAKDTGAQIECPVMGDPVDKDIYTDYNGEKIYFCCEYCIDKFKEDPEKYMKKIKKQTGARGAGSPSPCCDI